MPRLNPAGGRSAAGPAPFAEPRTLLSNLLAAVPAKGYAVLPFAGPARRRRAS